MVAQKGHARSPSRSLKIMYTNVDSLVSSLLELKDYLRNNKPDVVCLTETKLKRGNKVGICKGRRRIGKHMEKRQEKKGRRKSDYIGKRGYCC